MKRACAPTARLSVRAGERPAAQVSYSLDSSKVNDMRMKKVLFLAVALVAVLAAGCGSSGPGSGLSKSERKAAQEAQDQAVYQAAVQAIKERSFVLEADRVDFKRGTPVYVTPFTNFVSLDGNHAVIQLGLTGYSGLNGVGGITVDGTASGLEVKTDRRGNVNLKMSVQGAAVSATVTIKLLAGSNKASATVNPNFNSQRVSFTGSLYPTAESNVYKGRSL